MTDNENTIEDLTVLSRVNTGSDHRLIRARFNFRTRIERAKLVKTQTSKIDYKMLNAHQNLFQLELQNKFKELQVAEDDIESYNQNIIAIVHYYYYETYIFCKSHKSILIQVMIKIGISVHKKR